MAYLESTIFSHLLHPFCTEVAEHRNLGKGEDHSEGWISMAGTINTSQPQAESLIRYWNTIFVETPRCTAPGCRRVAQEVDAFFPYIDDYNRCDQHPRASASLAIN